MGITIESYIKDYQKDLNTHSTEYIIKEYILVVRFQQLNRYFQALLLQPKINKLPKTTFNRVIELTKYIWLTYRKLYTPKTYLTVNKTIQRFIGHTPKIVNIPSEPIPKGFKIQVLANNGYILDFIQYAKGNKKGLVNLEISFIV